MNEIELINALKALPRRIKPQRELWSGIGARLSDSAQLGKFQAQGSFGRHSAMAAAVVLALATGVFVGRGLDAPSTDEVSQSVFEFALAGTVMAAEREYQAAFRELVPLDYAGMSLMGEDPDVLRGSWADLLQAETSLLSALNQYPSNIYLQQKLLDLRARQLKFIKQLAMLEQNDWRRI